MEKMIIGKVVLMWLPTMLLLNLMISCDKKGIEPAGGDVNIKIYHIVNDVNSDTKVSLSVGNTVQWTDADTVYYYRYSSDHTTKRNAESVYVDANNEFAILPVEYTAGDAEVYAYVKGSGTGTVTAYDYDYLTISNGINAKQNGDFASQVVSAAKGFLNGSDTLEFKHLQTFISFSLSKNDVVSGQFNKIVISEAAASPAVNLAGASIKYSLGTASPSIESGGSKTITIDGVVSTTKTYYVAVMPGTYSNGLRLSFYNGSTLLCYVDTKNNMNLPKGSIVDLGSLEIHKVIPGEIIKMYPTTAAIVNKTGYQMTKKIWVEFKPSDLSGEKWTVSPTGVVKVTPQSEEEYKNDDGEKKWMKCALIEPLVEYGTCTVTLTFDCGATASCSLEVGDFVDLGLADYKWGYADMKGTSGIDVRMASPYENGDYYQWGAKKPLDVANNETGMKNLYTHWSGTWATDKGGRYNGTGKWGVELEVEDDIAYLKDHSWRIPKLDDFTALEGICSSSDRASKAGYSEMFYTSTKPGYTDVGVGFLISGSIQSNGGGGAYTHEFTDVVRVTRFTNSENYSLGGLTYPPYEAAIYWYKKATNPAAWRRRYGGYLVRPIQKKDNSDWPILYP